MPRLNLTADELLSTTRAVRKRLDLTRPVEPEVIAECVALAQQAPTGGMRERTHFVVVTDPALRAALGRIYREQLQWYATPEREAREARYDDPARDRAARGWWASALYLGDHLHAVPVHVIPCYPARTDRGDAPVMWQSTVFADAHMAPWSFMLAARARGLGTCFTTLHLRRERDVAELLGIPCDEVMQTALIPVAYTKGTEFKSALRHPVERILHWDRW